MKLPPDLSTLGETFNVSGYGANSGLCFEHHVNPGKSYVLFLQRFFVVFPLPGATIPPDAPFTYAPQEINFQEGVFNFTDKVEKDFVDYLTDCNGAGGVTAPIKYIAFFITSTLALYQLWWRFQLQELEKSTFYQRMNRTKRFVQVKRTFLILILAVKQFDFSNFFAS